MLGILNKPDLQMIFVDTPGWLSPRDSFQTVMKKAIMRSVYDDADAILWLVEPRLPSDEEKAFAETLLKTGKPVCVAVNKSDTLQGKEQIVKTEADVRGALPAAFNIFTISAKGKQGLDALVAALQAHLPFSPPYFPTDQLTDRWERFYVAELIREQIFSMFHQEIPHASAVVIEDFKEVKGRKDVIRAAIYVETEGQKQIVVGSGGKGIRDIGARARKEIEEKLGRPVYLELIVKVKKDWRNDAQFVGRLSEPT